MLTTIGSENQQADVARFGEGNENSAYNFANFDKAQKSGWPYCAKETDRAENRLGRDRDVEEMEKVIGTEDDEC